MATTSGGEPAALNPDGRPPHPQPLSPGGEREELLETVERALYAAEGICAFDFFQAVRMLILLGLKDRALVGDDGPPEREIVRFLAHLSLSFPASNLQRLTREAVDQPPALTVNFMGLTGPNGVLPRHYTERMYGEVKRGVRSSLQDWLDLFNHRFISFFYRAWEKYRFFLPFERSAAEVASAKANADKISPRDPDAFSRCLFSLIGLGFRSHRNRMRIAWAEPRQGQESLREQELGRLDDLGLLRFAGLFAHRPRCALSLEVFLQTYLQLPVKVLQFQGQWFQLASDSQTATGAFNNRLGQDTVVGDRIWDVQSKVRIRLGPLNYEQFVEFLPDRTPRAKRKRLFLLAQVVRYYLGAELDVDFQLVLRKEQVPMAQMGTNSRLGWNTWSKRRPYPRHADDTVFTVTERVTLH